jgi:leucyl aminopeptidase
MTAIVPEVLLAPGKPEEIVVDVLVVVFEDRAGSAEVSLPLLGATTVRSLQEAALAVGYRAKLEATVRVPSPPGIMATSVLFVGLGNTEAVRENTAEFHSLLRRAAGAALRAVDSIGSIALAFPVRDADDAEAVATGALLGAYRYTTYKSTTSGSPGLATITIAAHATVQPGIDRAAIIAASVAATRDLVNQPPSDLFPRSFADAVVTQAQGDDLKDRVVVDVIGEAELEQRGFGGLTGVGRGSIRGPRLVKVTYAPNDAAPLLSLVGKGITFDSGGISLKPAAKMETQKSDMAGAAAAVQALFAIARLGLPVRVTARLALAENMPSGSAVRPSDVLRIYGGKTVEVTNTDAEGRLVLADALVAAQEEAPDLLVDIATLTGAQVTALGRRTSGVMGTQSAQQQVMLAAAAAGEPMWAMPIPEEMIRYFDSKTADLKNAGAPAGGMLAAAAFLREFIGHNVEWAHLDVAGPAFNSDSAYGYTVAGGTGVPVRSLVALARSMSEQH